MTTEFTTENTTAKSEFDVMSDLDKIVAGMKGADQTALKKVMEAVMPLNGSSADVLKAAVKANKATDGLKPDEVNRVKTVIAGKHGIKFKAKK